MEQNQEQTTETTTAEPETVTLEEASMEDLDAYLANPEPESETKEQPKQAQQEEVQASTEEEEVQADDDTEPEEQPPRGMPTREEFDKNKRQLEGLELVVRRRTSEIGEIKKQLRDLIQQKKEGLEDRYVENPVKATDDLLDIKRAEARLQEVEQEEAHIGAHVETQRVVLKHVDFDQTPIDVIAEVFRDDGIPESTISAYMQNPWAIPATTTIQAAKRALEKRGRIEAEKYLRAALTEIKKLREQNSKLKTGSDVVKGIEAAARKGLSMDARSGGAAETSSEVDTNKPLSEMSDAELNLLLKKG